MQSPPFGIIRINNNNLHHTTNPPSKQGQGQGQQQLAPIPVTNPTNRVGQHGGGGAGEQGEQGKQSSGGAKKTRAFTGDSPHPPHHSDEPDAALPARSNDANDDDNVFADTSQTPRDEAESEGEEGMAVAAPATKKRRASNPYRPGCCGTLLFSSLRHNYPKDLPQGTTLLIKEWLPRTAKKKLGKSLRHSTW